MNQIIRIVLLLFVALFVGAFILVIIPSGLVIMELAMKCFIAAVLVVMVLKMVAKF